MDGMAELEGERLDQTDEALIPIASNHHVCPQDEASRAKAINPIAAEEVCGSPALLGGGPSHGAGSSMTLLVARHTPGPSGCTPSRRSLTFLRGFVGSYSLTQQWEIPD